MYAYQISDQSILTRRVSEFRQQTQRYLDGRLSEEQFRPLRLMNGLYFQLHAPMLRVAIPYGTLDATQMRMLARVAREYDRGYGHFTTRQNIQFNWPSVEVAPDILADLSRANMHAMQTSGNCVRNITTDHLAGVAVDEIEDPRPWCEMLRQWFTLHPEFLFLPRKFKMAISGASNDRAATRFHDIGLEIVDSPAGERGFRVLAGGGLGRAPVVASVVKEFLPRRHVVGFLEAIMRVYNEMGRRDNKHKARIKILVRELGIDTFRELVESEWKRVMSRVPPLDDAGIEALRDRFTTPEFAPATNADDFRARRLLDPRFARWLGNNTAEHRHAGYRAAYVSLKTHGQAPGDLDARRMEAVAELAERYSSSEIRVTHTQNLLFPHVRVEMLYDLWRELEVLHLAAAAVSRATDVICCPGLDYCSLANARSIPVAEEIQSRLAKLDEEFDIGDLRINISGCMNACGHHHVGHIGILGVEKRGKEWYQITLGGSSSADAAIGERVGPALPRNAVADAVSRIVQVYIENRVDEDENFLQTWRRLGAGLFKERIYGQGN
ncbi:MAG: nitrite/sulfite reductase [Proteobacteria bacterium]|nr:MAG: nitrite/sulfite reductase [Pseudomonadota bacterium]